MDATYLLIHLPLAVGMTARYELDARQLVVEVHFRAPLTPGDFEVRFGTGRYDASTRPHIPDPDGRDGDGWDVAVVRTAMEPGGAVKIWLSRRGTVADFGWELTLDLGRALSPELKRERFVAEWYRYGRKDYAHEVDARVPGMGKGDRPGDAFEVALANACGGLGYGVVFAGHLLQSAGVDLVAFDGLTHIAYVISATTGNDIAEKLRTWLSMKPLLGQALAPEWALRPIIITSQPADTLMAEDLTACHRQGVLVLAAEQLLPLKESPPDLQFAFSGSFPWPASSSSSWYFWKTASRLNSLPPTICWEVKIADMAARTLPAHGDGKGIRIGAFGRRGELVVHFGVEEGAGEDDRRGNEGVVFEPLLCWLNSGGATLEPVSEPSESTGAPQVISREGDADRHSERPGEGQDRLHHDGLVQERHPERLGRP
jgi:hypothetical protein